MCTQVPFRGFSAKHLFPNEPPYKRGGGSDVALLSKEGLLLPAGWRWAGEWRADRDAGTDADGWMYAFNWGVGAYAPSAQANHFVRRRIWSRTRVCVAGERAREAGAGGLAPADSGASPLATVVISLKQEEEEEEEDEEECRRAPAVPAGEPSGDWWWHRQRVLRLLKSRNARIREGAGAGAHSAAVRSHGADDAAVELLQNQARGKPVTVISNFDAARPPSNATDGRTDAFDWRSSVHTGANRQPYVEVDLGAALRIRMVKASLSLSLSLSLLYVCVCVCARAGVRVSVFVCVTLGWRFDTTACGLRLWCTPARM